MNITDTPQPPQLPRDLIALIAIWCDADTFTALARTCKQFRRRLCTRSVWGPHLDRICTKVEKTGWFSVFISWVLPNKRRHGPKLIRAKDSALPKAWSYARVSDQGAVREKWHNDGTRALLEHYDDHDQLHGTREEWTNDGVRILLEHYDHGVLIRDPSDQ